MAYKALLFLTKLILGISKAINLKLQLLNPSILLCQLIIECISFCFQAIDLNFVSIRYQFFCF